MRWDVTTTPIAEPVSIAEVKDHLRTTGTAEDAFITNLIVATREHCENWLGRKLMHQTISQWVDQWPEWHVDLAVGPASTLIAVYTYAESGTQTSHTITNFYLQPGLAPRLFRNAISWPSAGRVADGIEISYAVGFGAAVDVPPAIRHGILLLVAHLYQNRGDSPAKASLDSGAEQLWRPYRSIRL